MDVGDERRARAAVELGGERGGEREDVGDDDVRRKLAHERAESNAVRGPAVALSGGSGVNTLAAWLAVGIPLAIGILITLQKAANLFR